MFEVSKEDQRRPTLKRPRMTYRYRMSLDPMPDSRQAVLYEKDLTDVVQDLSIIRTNLIKALQKQEGKNFLTDYYE